MLPFTRDQFLQSLADYNVAAWPMQWLLLGVALACVVLAIRGGDAAGRWISLVLAALWAWMAIAYHLAIFAAINPAARIFALGFLAAAGVFAWQGAVRGRLRFEARAPSARAGLLLMALALVVYPAASWLLGHRYPATPTFGLPCPATIFTLGILLTAVRPRPGIAFAVPLVWTVIGGLGAVRLGMHEDLLLPLAGAVAAAIQSRDSLMYITVDPGSRRI
jgi:hypothetical protein